jgi:hypothetical protein
MAMNRTRNHECKIPVRLNEPSIPDACRTNPWLREVEVGRNQLMTKQPTRTMAVGIRVSDLV